MFKHVPLIFGMDISSMGKKELNDCNPVIASSKVKGS
jgi:hypothetical protein